MKKKILVTGVAGFIGSHVARRLEAEGCQVIGVDNLSQGYEKNIPQGVEFIQGDLSFKSFVQKLPACEIVMHLAGQSSGEISFDDPVSDLSKNTVSTLNLIDWSLTQGVEKFLYASSMSVYGAQPDIPVVESAVCMPLSCYGIGKLASEHYLQVYSRRLPAISLRMFNVYGPGQDLSNMRQGMVSIFVKQALAGGNIHVKGSLDRYRDMIFIDDVVDAWASLMRITCSGHTAINIGTGKKTTVGQLIEAISQYIPGVSCYAEGSTPGDQHGIFADIGRWLHLAGEKSFVTLADGLSRFIPWARSELILKK